MLGNQADVYDGKTAALLAFVVGDATRGWHRQSEIEPSCAARSSTSTGQATNPRSSESAIERALWKPPRVPPPKIPARL
ncbi:MAG: hypothetical protein RMJ98_05750 [Myxococcales bacterium]|nr:hypothetical protein [Polyangiaceae bacterium]MDW8248796.1 hypothetical protein [Myxococcales bacterium]